MKFNENSIATEHSSVAKIRQRVDVFAVNKRFEILSHIPPKGHINLPYFPGGGIDKDETIEIAAIRETMEESGWIIDNLSLISVENNTFNGIMPKWLSDQKIDSEQTFIIKANPIIFCPDETFGIENDHKDFKLNNVRSIVNLIEYSLKNDPLRPNLRFIAQLWYNYLSCLI